MRTIDELIDDHQYEFRDFAAKLDVHDLSFVPISALNGDNVVERSANMPWYEGASLLHHLEDVHIASDRNLIDCRFPVQYVIRPMRQDYHDYRGYAGRMAGGVLRVGMIALASTGEPPIGSFGLMPRGATKRNWGSEWKKAALKYKDHTAAIGTSARITQQGTVDAKGAPLVVH